MIKVSRQNLSESYNVTADWLGDFIKDMHRKSNINNIKHLVMPNYSTATIEQKMADIKQRVGFDIIMAKNEIKEHENKTAQVAKEDKFSKQDVETMANILKYITDMVNHEKNLDVPTVLGRCRDEDGLHFHNLNIDVDKLKEFIEQKIKEKNQSESHETISYLPFEAPTTDEMLTDSDADYYSHTSSIAS